MKNLRLTPLNIVCAMLLVAAAYMLLFPDEAGWRLLGSIPLFVIALICFIADIIFRRALRSLKRIWIVELIFIIFAAVLTLLIRGM